MEGDVEAAIGLSPKLGNEITDADTRMTKTQYINKGKPITEGQARGPKINSTNGNDRIGDWLIEEAKLLTGVRSQVEAIQAELSWMKCFLKDADAKHKAGATERNFVIEIQDIAYDVEDVIETFVLRLSSRRGRSGEDFIGLESDVKNLVEHLLNEDEDSYNWHQTVCICGMGGLGKTTLAQRVYNHNNVNRHFDCLAWACISQQLQKQDVLQGILIKFVPEKKEEIRGMRDEELVRMLFDVQQKKKCLIVVDDIWTVETWDILRSAFPIGKKSNSRSKVLLTTRNKEVAQCVNPEGLFHEPPFLTDGEAGNCFKRKHLEEQMLHQMPNRDLYSNKMMIIGLMHCGNVNGAKEVFECMQFSNVVTVSS
ncbi:probable disease resistance protein RXW24L [Cornus florida]|uniref:probable disease resistance protein RXW24L n=1 Tax=Cornus florida TaxID=4283 RepID=UPI0028A0A763|nr:probable disease resistance protein RXW24L [Cornus florida]